MLLIKVLLVTNEDICNYQMIIILLIKEIVIVLVTFLTDLCMLRGIIVCYFILHLFIC